MYYSGENVYEHYEIISKYIDIWLIQHPLIFNVIALSILNSYNFNTIANRHLKISAKVHFAEGTMPRY